ncbi:MAG: hypothetical protein HQM08_26465 [Candidatus Riflebacteria bacterium]|nr:hypothetical protein [Candidatus Riflebacteria bacterium]
MTNLIWEIFINLPKRFIGEAIEAVKEINQKYAVPKIKTRPAVSFALLMLRLYLVLMVGLLFYKFYTSLPVL